MSEVLREFSRRKDGKEDEWFLMGIVRRVNGPRRNVCHLSGPEDSVLFANPLFSAPVHHVNDLLTVWMIMKRVAVHGIHVRANEQEFLRFDQVWPAEPLVIGPRIGLAKRVGDLDETCGGSRHVSRPVPTLSPHGERKRDLHEEDRPA